MVKSLNLPRFVMTCDRVLSVAEADHIRAAWAEFVGGDDHAMRLFIVDAGMKLSVLGEPGKAE